MIDSVWIHSDPMKVLADVPLPSAARADHAHLMCRFHVRHARRKASHHQHSARRQFPSVDLIDTGFRWRPSFGSGLDSAASAIRTALASAASRICCAGARLIEERLTRTDELLRLLLVDRHCAELRSLQHRLDLRRQCIALRGP